MPVELYDKWIGPGLGFRKDFLEDTTFDITYDKWGGITQTNRPGVISARNSRSAKPGGNHFQWPKWGKHRSALKKCKKNFCGCSSEKERERVELLPCEIQNLVVSGVLLPMFNNWLWWEVGRSLIYSFCQFPCKYLDVANFKLPTWHYWLWKLGKKAHNRLSWALWQTLYMHY